MQKRDSNPDLRRDSSKATSVSGRVVRFGTTARHTIPYKVLKARGWKEVDDDSWDFFYADVGWIHENITYTTSNKGLTLEPHQRVNHFPNHVELTRKDLMAKNVKRAIKLAVKEGRDPSEFDFIPVTYTLPSEGNMLLREFKERGGTWIMKPIGRAQGKGIWIASKPSQIEQWMKERGMGKAENNVCYENFVAQRYLEDPYLVGGKKFDMRIYAVCLSYNPLRVYLYREGFARFTATRYSKEDFDNPMVHLTNHAIQKKDDAYDASVSDLKWSFPSLKRYMLTKHGPAATTECWAGIHNIITGSLKAVQGVMINDKHCFEMYGYDVMIDDDLKPWLIEVNASPSMSSDTQTDHDLKFGLLDDMLTLIDMTGSFRGQLPPRVGGFDLVYDGEPKRHESWGSYPTMLGCNNRDREDALRRLKKWTESLDPNAEKKVRPSDAVTIVSYMEKEKREKEKLEKEKEEKEKEEATGT
jgi:tubulin polyglutamylase TTLL9|tara:strand:- start:1027 stop:2439 length:1413 start_codon:yes stop_codon:yes gene_type:complete